MGVSLVRSGARQVLLTDGNEEAVSNCCHNIEFNYRSVSTVTGARCRSSGDPVSASVAPDAGPAPHVTVEVLGWGSRCVEADIIVAADVIYDESVLGSLVKQLQMQLRGEIGCDEEPGVGTTIPDAQGVEAEERAVAVIASTVRNPETLNSFVKQCKAAGLIVRELERVHLGHNNRTEFPPTIRWQHCQALEANEELILHRVS